MSAAPPLPQRPANATQEEDTAATEDPPVGILHLDWRHFLDVTDLELRPAGVRTYTLTKQAGAYIRIWSNEAISTAAASTNTSVDRVRFTASTTSKYTTTAQLSFLEWSKLDSTTDRFL